MNKPFKPEFLPLENLDWEGLIPLIGQASQSIARFDGHLDSMPEPSLLTTPFITQEAVSSSKIEGTMATMEEVLEFEVNPSGKGERAADFEEVLNYRQTLRYAEEDLQNRPICLNMIRDMHSILLQGVRGQARSRGDFRTIQNHIGRPGSPIEEAVYIPPSPELVLEYLSNWEKYWHSDEKDPLVQLAILHAQFEMIHPFLDGNGRIGRILVPLFLFDKNVLTQPVFYISTFLEATREEYYDRLLRISNEGNWTGWVAYFLRAIIEQSKNNSQKIKDILLLYEKMKEIIVARTHSQFSIQMLDFLFRSPVFTAPMLSEEAHIPWASANRIVKRLREEKTIKVIRQGAGRRPSIYIFPELLNLSS